MLYVQPKDQLKPEISRRLLSLGQSFELPYAEDIKRLIYAYPKCFEGIKMVPAIQSSIDFCNSVETWDLPSDLKSQADQLLSQAKWKLEWWKDRLSKEADIEYCASPPTRNGVSSEDHALILRALTLPYIEASGISGMEERIKQIRAEFIDETIGKLPIFWMAKKFQQLVPPSIAFIPWWVWVIAAGVGGVALFSLYFKLKK